MNWRESLAQLKILGYSFYQGQDTIKYKYLGQSEPQRTQVQTLLKILAVNKAEVLKALREESSRDEKKADEALILGMDLIQFRKAGLTIKIWSDLLEKEIWLVPGDSDIKRIPRGQASYTVAELEILVNQNPGSPGLLLIDAVKESFGGQNLQGSQPARTRSRPYHST